MKAPDFGIRKVKETVRRLTADGAAAALRRRSQPLPPLDGVLLVIAPHPDDETLGCGGFIARQARAGRRVHVLFVTDGEASHPEHPALTRPELADRRREEAIAALQALGVAQPRAAATFLGAPDGALDRLPAEDATAVVDVLKRWIRADRPEIVLAPFLGGGSSEHDAVATLVRRALAEQGGGRLLEYPVWAWCALRLRGQVGSAQHNFRLDLGDLRAVKRQAILCHRTQVEPVPPWTEPILPAAILGPCSGPTEFYFACEVPGAAAI